MDSNLLKVFVTVAQEKSITLGARKLNYAQSNVTSRIKQLERNLGYDLFHRVPSGVKMTPEGEKLYPFAIDIVNKVEVAFKEMKNIKKQEYLRVGSTESNAVIRIVPFLLQLHGDYPNMQLELITQTTTHITKLLLDYQVDIAFISGIPKHKDLVVLNSFDETMVEIDNLENKSPNKYLVFKSGCAYNDFAVEYLKAQNNEDFKLLEFGSYETILGCVEAGIGKAIIPLSIVEKLGYTKRLNIRVLEKENANIPTCMVCRKDYIPKISTYLKRIKL